jgi:hypothetical protein
MRGSPGRQLAGGMVLPDQLIEVRDFQISYTVPDAAIAYDDCVVYFQKYLSESNTPSSAGDGDG